METSWADVRSYLRGTYKIAVDLDDHMAVDFRFPDAVAVQRLLVMPVMAFGQRWLELSAFIGPDSAMGAHAALAHNASLAVGSLCIAQGHIVLRIVLPLAATSTTTLDRTMKIIAHEAARLRTSTLSKPALAPYYE
jgi:hypothetical protein